MATYHFDLETGNVGSCKARSISLCAFGSIDSHFTSLEAAEAGYGEFLRLQRDALDVDLLGHGDRIHLRSPNDQLLDAVINDTGQHLLIITAGTSAPTNDVNQLIDLGWTLEKRIGAFGDFAVNPNLELLAIRKLLNKAWATVQACDGRAIELREEFKSSPKNSWLKMKLGNEERLLMQLRADHEELLLEYTEWINLAKGGRKESGFTGLHDIPYGFTGRNDYNGVPTYLYDDDGSFVQEVGDGYAYFRNIFDEPVSFQNFGEAMLWLKSEALKLQDQS